MVKEGLESVRRLTPESLCFEGLHHAHTVLELYAVNQVEVPFEL
jgi:hypothetical protein